MLKNIIPAERVVDISYELSFDDGRHNGFGFPCDEDGNVSPTLNSAALENLEYCKAHPEKFIRYGVVDRRKQMWVNPAHGTCRCGETVELINEYCGACSCKKCGKWYNLFGQELLPPEQWESDDEEWW